MSDYTIAEREQIARLIEKLMLDLQTGVAMTQAPSEGPLWAITKNQEKLGARPNELSVGLASARMSIVVAADFAKAFAGLLRQHNQIGFAFGSVARSAAEASGRADYILSYTDQQDLLARWTRARKLSHASYASSLAASDDSGHAMAKRIAGEIEAILDGLKLTGKARGVTHGSVAVTLLDKVFKSTTGSSEYSFLSSMSHGDNSATETFTTVVSTGTGPEGLNTTKLQMPSNLILRCWMAVGGGVLVASMRLFKLANLHHTDRGFLASVLDQSEAIARLMHD
ncbi:hypothetical protein [Herbiconiux liangxiaofengii]|uniref:hypothetical protein n=1 Tax=Herbiconiux liangxiaofengii TaxID=3342795 RepID=UPI0035B8E9C2